MAEGPKSDAPTAPLGPGDVGAADATTDPRGSPPRESRETGFELDELSPSLYRLGEEFARGGLGRILKAHDKRLDRDVAIKELHFMHPVAEARFAREVQVTARLQHPSIVPVHEAGRWPSGEPFYAMKLVDGASLAAVISRKYSFTERLSLMTVVLDVAEAMAYAHSQRIIHRDLKPANVLVGPFGETVVIDWGLAKNLDEGDETLPELPAEQINPDGYHTTDGAVVGTPAYMPPEQAAGKSVDETADVYALGALLYHVIAGHRPYSDEFEGNVLDRARRHPPTPLAQLVPEAPRDLVAIAEKAMARRPQDRYPTAREMAEELARFTTGRMVGAHRYTSWELLQRFVQRNRAAVVTGTFALLALIIVGAASFKRITEARNRAEESRAAEAKARQVAEERVDLLVVEKARSLLETDPTQALAWLKRLSRPVAGAASVVALAEEARVARSVLRGHGEIVTDAAYSPTGSQLASASDDKTVRVWDDRGLLRALAGHTDRVTEVRYSPDGRLLASASYDGTVRLWNTQTFTSEELRGHDGAVKAVAFAADGETIASVGADGTVRWWTPRGEQIAKASTEVDRSLFASFAPDGRLVTGSHDGTLHLWTRRGGRPMVLRGHAGEIKDAAFSPDGRWLASAGSDGTVRLWRGSQARVSKGHTGAVNALAFSPGGELLATAGMDKTVRLWRTGTDDVEVLFGHRERVATVAFSPDGRWLASASWDKTVRLHEVSTHQEHVLRGHGDVVTVLRFSPKRGLLATGAWDKTLRIWQAPAVGTERRIFTGHTVGVHGVDFSPDGRWVASGGHDNAVRLWGLDDGVERVLEGHTDHVFRVLFSPDGKLVASSSDDRTVRLWPLDGGRPRVLGGHQADVEELAFSSDGRWLVSGSEDNTARLWSLEGGADVTLAGHDNHVVDVAFSPGDDLVATSSRDRTVRLWSARTGELIKVLEGHGDEVLGLHFSPRGDTLASASADDSVRLWNLTSGQGKMLGDSLLPGARLVRFAPDGKRVAVVGRAPFLWVCDVTSGGCRQLLGPRSVVHDILFTASGDVLVTAGGDGTVHFWDVDSGERRERRGHAAAVFDIDLSPDGKRVVSASGDATVRLWDVRPPPRPDQLEELLSRLTHERIAEAAQPESAP